MPVPYTREPALFADWCDECGARHSPERRQATIRRMLPATPREIAEMWPHLYPDFRRNSASARMLVRDLHAIGARAARQWEQWEEAV